MNQKGVTTTEMIIYIVLFAIVSILLGKQFGSLVKNYSRGKRVSIQQSDSRDILAMMSREIRNTGFKTYVTGTATELSVNRDENAYIHDVDDLSSFRATHGDPSDILEFYKTSLDENGDYQQTDVIKYYLTGTTLMRDHNDQEKTIAENVHALQFEYGVFAADDELLDAPASGWETISGTAGKNVQGTDLNLSVGGEEEGTIRNTTTFTVAADQNISVSFGIVAAGGFPGNLNELAFRVQDAYTYTTLGQETFLPSELITQVTFPVKQAAHAKICLDYKASGSGDLQIDWVKVIRRDLGEYNWKNDEELATAEKRNVRAIRILALTRSGGETNTATAPETMTISNITFPISGNYVWRLHSETVEIPNNGVL